MDIPSIHVHTQSDKNTMDFVTFMWSTMRSLANHPELLQLSVHCMGPTATERLATLPAARTYRIPDVMAGNALAGSMGHGVCVEHALSMTDDGDIHIIVDSDTVVLAKGWDDYVRLELFERRVGTIGTTYEEVGGFTSGNGNLQTYKGVPNVVWMALSPLHRWRDLKALPKKDEEFVIKNPGMSKVYGLPVGYKLLRDVAWQIPEYLHNRGISHEGWRQRKPSKDAAVLRGLYDYHEEYHVTADNVPFVVHHRGSMRHPYRGDEISRAFYNAVDAHLARERTREPRWVWRETPETVDALTQLRETKLQAEKRRSAQWPAFVQKTLNGWLKATLDGNSVWSRYAQPVPKTIDVKFDGDSALRNFRLEGTVSHVHVTLPAAYKAPYAMTIRNLTSGPARFKTLGGQFHLDVPQGRCWLVLVDADGPVHVE